MFILNALKKDFSQIRIFVIKEKNLSYKTYVILKYTLKVYKVLKCQNKIFVYKIVEVIKYCGINKDIL